MRFVNICSLALSIALLSVNSALGADTPVYQNGILTTPSVNTAEQVGKYQDVTFQLTSQGLWQLTTLKTIGAGATELTSPLIGLTFINKVDVLKTDSFPSQVFLRVTGGWNTCDNIIQKASFGQINQRLDGNRFDVSITYNYFVMAVVECLPVTVLFQRTTPLSVYGLSAGTYSYNVNGTTGTFELTADNKYPGDY